MPHSHRNQWEVYLYFSRGRSLPIFIFCRFSSLSYFFLFVSLLLSFLPLKLLTRIASASLLKVRVADAVQIYGPVSRVRFWVAVFILLFSKGSTHHLSDKLSLHLSMAQDPIFLLLLQSSVCSCNNNNPQYTIQGPTGSTFCLWFQMSWILFDSLISFVWIRRLL